MDKHHTYPLYHTLYETPFTSEHLMDVNNFAIHRAIGQYWIELAVQLADEPTVPYSLSTLSTKLVRDYIPNLAESIISMNMTAYTADGYQQLSQMAVTASNLLNICRSLEATTWSRSTDPLVRSRYNDRLINFERCFVNPRGTPDDPTARHVLFSISKTDSYSGEVMQQVYKVNCQFMIKPTAPQTPDRGLARFAMRYNQSEP
ncbi:transferrin receptor-like dimerization domain protein, partial [Oesophagostomum dentatum]